MHVALSYLNYKIAAFKPYDLRHLDGMQIFKDLVTEKIGK